jgi:hypothetical protein
VVGGWGAAGGVAGAGGRATGDGRRAERVAGTSGAGTVGRGGTASERHKQCRRRVRARGRARRRTLDAVDVGNGGLRGPREGEEFVGHDPVEVAVLDALVVLVLVRVESSMVVPAERHGLGEAAEAVEDGDRVRGRAERRVAIRHERRLRVAEEGPRLLGRATLADDEIGAAEQDRVGARVGLRLADVVDALVGQLRILQLVIEHAAVPAELRNVERPKVAVVRVVHEDVVGAEEGAVVGVERHVAHADPVQPGPVGPGWRVVGPGECNLPRHLCLLALAWSFYRALRRETTCMRKIGTPAVSARRSCPCLCARPHAQRAWGRSGKPRAAGAPGRSATCEADSESTEVRKG